jgi:diguanylate cyclase (GGDEF)-like protein
MASGLLIAGLLLTAFLSFQLPNRSLGLLIFSLSLLLAVLAGLMVYVTFSQLFKPMQILIRETEETLQGIRAGGISIVRDDEIGLLANNFNQIILDAQMKRMELETSNLELASHTEIIEKTYRELDKKVYDLFTLFNIGKELNSTLSMETILKITCFTSMGQLGITVMSIMLMDEHDGNKLSPIYMKGLRKDPERPVSIRPGEDFVSQFRLNDQPIILNTMEDHPEFKAEIDFLTAYKTHLIAPLTAKDQVIGLLLLGKKLSGEEFTQSEKDFLTTLTSLSALALRNARHYEQAITDEMTKLYLKRYFQLRLDEELKRAARYHSKVALMMIDIDHFKSVNDTWGHTKGDEVLTRVAKAIRENFRDVDVPARYGGEEFAVIMPEVSKRDALVAAERLRNTVAAIPFPSLVLDNGGSRQITISLGISEFPGDGKMPLQLIEASDAALYRSKETGRNQTTLA